MTYRRPLLRITGLLIMLVLACQAITTGPLTSDGTATIKPTETTTPSPLPPIPVMPGEENPDEPVFITGDIPYTSPFFINTISEPFILLEDQAGFVARDHEFQFPLRGQSIGPVEVHDDDSLTYSLALPAIPQGTQLDVDNNGENDSGVQIFAVAYWSNTWGGPFLEERDGGGWSNAYASTITDPERDDEIKGGLLIVWAPDDQQSFPSAFGEDELLFTEDDPTTSIPAGYSIVDLNQDPFHVYKESRPNITLIEGEGAVNDFSEMSYSAAFDSMFEKASREYPFTKDKRIDWDALYDEFSPRVSDANTENDFFRAVRDFTYAIPDAHVGVSFNSEVFYSESGGSFGLVLAELSDGRVIVTQVLPDTPGEKAGIKVGAEILTWDDHPVSEAISQVISYFGPYSSVHHERLEQVVFLTRVPPDTRIPVTFQNPGESDAEEVTMKAEIEYDSLFKSIPSLNEDELVLSIQGEVMDEFGLGYIRITTFSDDYNLMARLWEHYIEGLIDNEVPGLIIDIRTNSGGSAGMVQDFAGYFFDKEISLYRSYYYNDLIGDFEETDYPARIEPAPLLYDGPIAVLVSPYCVSACEGFAYSLTQDNRSIVVGHQPTAGAFGEVGRGQYKLPGDYSLQFPTGRPETMDNKLLIEGVGVVPDIIVPVTEDSALGKVDTVLFAAIEALLEQIDQ